MVVRSTLHRLGYRYTLHAARLPGHPDLTFPARRKVIFVHGCFWHGHDCTHGRRSPGSNVEFWEQKYRENRSRDARKQAALKTLGWKVLVVWECDVKANRWLRRVRRFLGEAPRG